MYEPSTVQTLNEWNPGKEIPNNGQEFENELMEVEEVRDVMALQYDSVLPQ